MMRPSERLANRSPQCWRRCCDDRLFQSHKILRLLRERETKIPLRRRCRKKFKVGAREKSSAQAAESTKWGTTAGRTSYLSLASAELCGHAASSLSRRAKNGLYRTGIGGGQRNRISAKALLLLQCCQILAQVFDAALDRVLLFAVEPLEDGSPGWHIRSSMSRWPGAKAENVFDILGREHPAMAFRQRGKVRRSRFQHRCHRAIANTRRTVTRGAVLVVHLLPGRYRRRLRRGLFFDRLI